MPVLYKSYDATIRPSLKSTNAVFIDNADFFLFFFSIQYLGVLQLVLKPLIFIKTKQEFYITAKNINLIRQFEIFETEENRTIVFPNKNGIKKVITPITSGL
jgi:hypothetical protein